MVRLGLTLGLLGLSGVLVEALGLGISGRSVQGYSKVNGNGEVMLSLGQG